MRYKFLWIFALLLFAGDVGMTMYGMQSAEYSEANPSVQGIAAAYGDVTAALMLFPIKVMGAAFGLVGQWFSGLRRDRGSGIVYPLMTIGIIGMPPVLWNLWVLA